MVPCRGVLVLHIMKGHEAAPRGLGTPSERTTGGTVTLLLMSGSSQQVISSLLQVLDHSGGFSRGL